MTFLRRRPAGGLLLAGLVLTGGLASMTPPAQATTTAVVPTPTHIARHRAGSTRTPRPTPSPTQRLTTPAPTSAPRIVLAAPAKAGAPAGTVSAGDPLVTFEIGLLGLAALLAVAGVTGLYLTRRRPDRTGARRG